MSRLAPLLLLFAFGSPATPRVVTFPPRGPISAVAFEDLNGDGRKEILIWRGRRLSVHFATETGGYDVIAPRVTEVDRNALYFGTGQVDADERTREVVLATPEGITFHAVAEGGLSPRATRMIEARNLVTTGQGDAIHPGGFLRDLDGDGLPDVALATADGFALYYQRRHGEGEEAPAGAPGKWSNRPDRVLPYALATGFDVGRAGLTGRIRGRAGVPDLLPLDFTGDGRADLAIDDGRTLRIFAAGDDGRVAGTEPTVVDLTPLAGADGRVPAFRLADVNADGAPDYLVPRVSRGEVALYLGGRPLGEPDGRLPAKGELLPLRILDLNGDGRLDLLVPHTPNFSLPTAVSVTFSHALTVNASVFLNTGDPAAPFATVPNAVREIRVKIRVYMDATGRILADRSVLMAVEGDFDGDRQKDLLIREGTDELLLFPGTEEGVFAEDEALAIGIPDTKDCSGLTTTVVELDGDGRPDVAIRYASPDGAKDRLVLLLSGGRK